MSLTEPEKRSAMGERNAVNGVTIPPRELQPEQSTQIVVVDVRTGTQTVVHERSDLLLEAPNWSLDGEHLVLNGDFHLWRLDLSSGELEQIVIDGVPLLNNDHVLDRDGEHVYVSAFDWNIHRVPIAGGTGDVIRPDVALPGLKCFLHGIDPAGERLAFIGVHPVSGDDWWGQADVFTMAIDGADCVQLTDGPGPSDGCEYSADGEWIYFNTETFDGHAQIARMRLDGSDKEQLTFDEHVNWFPHLSPDGQWACYLAFPPGTEGHPADVWVEVRLVHLEEWSSPTTVARVFGGQGTLNVNSWSPDSSAFAYVAYPTTRVAS